MDPTHLALLLRSVVADLLINLSALLNRLRGGGAFLHLLHLAVLLYDRPALRLHLLGAAPPELLLTLPLLDIPALLHGLHLALLVLLRPGEDPGNILTLDVHKIVAGLLGYLRTRGHHLVHSLAPLENINITLSEDIGENIQPAKPSPASSLIIREDPLGWLAGVYCVGEYK